MEAHPAVFPGPEPHRQVEFRGEGPPEVVILQFGRVPRFEGDADDRIGFEQGRQDRLPEVLPSDAADRVTQVLLIGGRPARRFQRPLRGAAVGQRGEVGDGVGQEVQTVLRHAQFPQHAAVAAVQHGVMNLRGLREADRVFPESRGQFEVVRGAKLLGEVVRLEQQFPAPPGQLRHRPGQRHVLAERVVVNVQDRGAPRRPVIGEGRLDPVREAARVGRSAAGVKVVVVQPGHDRPGRGDPGGVEFVGVRPPRLGPPAGQQHRRRRRLGRRGEPQQVIGHHPASRPRG